MVKTLSKIYKGKINDGSSILEMQILINGGYLFALENVLKDKEIPNAYYSIGGYSEDAVCIEYENNKWIVYIGERGKRHELEYFNDVKYACYNLISRVSENIIEKIQMKRSFKHRINKYYHYSKTNHSRRGMLKLVGRRRGLLNYIKKEDIEAYRVLIDKLNQE